MASLPLTQPVSQQDTRWKALLDPILANPISQSLLLTNVSVVTGVNQINHGLGRKLQGYVVVTNSAAATFHDNQTTNQMTDLTLALVSTAPATITLLVF